MRIETIKEYSNNKGLVELRLLHNRYYFVSIIIYNNQKVNILPCVGQEHALEIYESCKEIITGGMA